MESHSHSSRVSLSHASGADRPARPRWRLFSWSIGVGTALLAFSVLTAALAVHSPSRADSGSSGGSSGSSSSHRRAAAIAFVDVEEGVRNLYPVQQGRVAELPVPEGKEVPAGTVLLRLDDTLVKIKVAQAEVALDCARKRLDQAKQLRKQYKAQIKAQEEAVEAAKSEKSSAEEILKKTRRQKKDKLGASDEDIQVARAAVVKAAAGIRAAQAKLKAIEAMEPETTVEMAELDIKVKEQQVEEAKYALKEHTVVAPCKGKVLRCLTRVGEVLATNPKQPAIEFCPSSERVVRAEVEQEFANQVSVGQKARITDDAKTSTSEWTGTVKRVSDWFTQRRATLFEPMQFNDVRTLEVILRLDDPKNTLRIGQRVRVELEEKEKK
jgi:multidrug resistance efflux pump